MSVKITEGGSAEITLTIPAAEAKAVGSELAMLADWMDTVLWALTLLRTGHNHRNGSPVTIEDLYSVIEELDRRLSPRLKGLIAAAIRRHAELGGTYKHLARAMDVSRSTAQRRRDSITSARPSAGERWATGEHSA
ncbi:hypothetical protein ABZV75_40005 [Streptomyces flaveolus]|uniref:hypothetical protein n=1 Tax=Streptomyces flaveolus TaxID=67297 RepID=UPI0033BC8BBE